MLKIGILTYIKEFMNLGTNMQSFCTQQAIRNIYPTAQVELIDYLPWKPAMRPYLSHISIESLKNDVLRIVKYKNFFKDNLTLSGNRLVSANLHDAIEFINKQNYDAIYVGADTVLELRGSQGDQLTAYWLDEGIRSTKFLIAASSHNVTFESLSDPQKLRIQKTIKDFSLLGVRDDATFRLISHFLPPGDTRLRMIPDPTFTYDINYSHAERYVRMKGLRFDKPVVCLHLVRDSHWASQLAGEFRKAGYIIASLRPAHYADLLLTDLSPFEQMGIYRYFDLLITHRFHDSIFCLKNLTPLIVFHERPTDVTPYGESKNQTLMKSFALEKTNYVAHREHLSAEYFIDTYRGAINVFKTSRDHIKSVLIENKSRYESFLNESRI
jgi:Polysaccharide pyruvyl transferase